MAHIFDCQKLQRSAASTTPASAPRGAAQKRNVSPSIQENTETLTEGTDDVTDFDTESMVVDQDCPPAPVPRFLDVGVEAKVGFRSKGIMCTPKMLGNCTDEHSGVSKL